MVQQQWWQITRNDEVPFVAPNRQPRFGAPLPSEVEAENAAAVESEVDNYPQLLQALLRTRPQLNEVYRADRLPSGATKIDSNADADTNTGTRAYLDGSG